MKKRIVLKISVDLTKVRLPQEIRERLKCGGAQSTKKGQKGYNRQRDKQCLKKGSILIKTGPFKMCHYLLR